MDVRGNVVREASFKWKSEREKEGAEQYCY